MSSPEGKAIYLIAFSLLLSYIRELTDQSATHPTYSLFMLKYKCIFAFLKYCFLSLSCYSKVMFNLNFLSLWKSIICVPFNQKRIPIRMKLFLFPLTKFLNLFLRIFVLIVCLLFLIVQPLKQFLIMKNETKSKIWSAIFIASAAFSIIIPPYKLINLNLFSLQS